MKWGYLVIVLALVGVFVVANYETFFPTEEPMRPEPPAPEPEVTPVEEPEPVPEPEPVVEPEPISQPMPVPSEEPVEEMEVIQEEKSETLESYMQDAEKKYDGYGYWKDEVEKGVYGIAQRDDRILLKFKRIQIVDQEATDTVLVYRQNQSAVATCLGRGCASSYGKVFDVSFERYNPETILDEIKPYLNQEVVEESDSVLISDFDAAKVSLKNGMKVHIDRKTRFPLLIENKDGNVIDRVNGVYFETIKQAPLTLQTKQLFEFS